MGLRYHSLDRIDVGDRAQCVRRGNECGGKRRLTEDVGERL